MRLIRHITPPYFKHLINLAIRTEYRTEYRKKYEQERELKRLGSLERYESTITYLLGAPLTVVDGFSFLEMYEEIFRKQIYQFKANHEHPYIIDGGANIGLSVIYFKSLYPKSHIIAFEPDSQIFAVLERNVKSFGYSDIELVCKALSSSETHVDFVSEGSYAGRIARSTDHKTGEVKAVRLREYIEDCSVDFLKLDIEGAETDVLQDCADLLHNVDKIFIEYHSFLDEPQMFHKLVSILADAGFRLHVHPDFISPNPFLYRLENWEMDLQLDIFAFHIP
jgi:FkbM family methyltransferase